MDSEQLAKNFKKEFVVDLVKSFSKNLNTSTQSSKDFKWNKSTEFYQSLNEEQKDNLKSILHFLVVDTLAGVFSYLDDSGRFENQDYSLELIYNKENIGNYLLDEFLSEIELNGFEDSDM
ncbi:hypothetical protein KLA_15655 [Cellulophaga geojensis KL-A]|uniref:Uncharacterized protein n=1 Tax=Cellulophaga geojensis KL-A TaxID=1328323 RepID=A0ABN0RK45_9FLAO|nr:hypothetical protein [Cellulophaga geojensis]EWH11446.1 hypothetical protein KLA_15655 [Cellulophaga geojensis KL-A]